MLTCRKYFFSAALYFLMIGVTTAQKGVSAFNNNVYPVLESQGNAHGLFKASLIFALKKGTSVGLSYGIWQENPSLQYSLNAGLMLRMGKRFLGNFSDRANKNDPRSRSQLNFMFSPMLTVNFSKERWAYQEIEPFYLGLPNAVFCKYAYYTTIGTTFVISPRGTYNNVATVRNRTQQDFMFSINIKNFNFTMFDDYFPVFTTFLQLGDNYDRYYTGGGFIRYRFNDEFTLHLHSEVYTGTNQPNAFLHPDIISYRQKGRRWKLKNFASQNQGQEFFNSSWFIARLSYTGPQIPVNRPVAYIPNIDMFIGSSAPWTMFSQNAIHTTIKYDPSNNLQLHYFLPRTNVPGNLEAGGKNNFDMNMRSLFIGGGFQANISMP